MKHIATCLAVFILAAFASSSVMAVRHRLARIDHALASFEAELDARDLAAAQFRAELKDQWGQDLECMAQLSGEIDGLTLRVAALERRESLIEGQYASVAASILRRRPSLGPDIAHRYAKAVLASAYDYSLDPALIVALIEVESRWDSRAESGTGAVGLCQVTGWWSDKLFDMGAPEFRRRLLADPEYAIDAGARVLRYLLDEECGQDMTCALARYNGGGEPNYRYARNVERGRE
jgi:soluble lytic murein transglycosylase-like protein